MERTHLSEDTGCGTKDGTGAADNDQPYTFGRRPRVVAPWPFTERQFAHLLVMRGRVKDAADPADHAESHPIAFLDDGVWIASQNDLLQTRPARASSQRRRKAA
jgi:hypothetical protein